MPLKRKCQKEQDQSATSVKSVDSNNKKKKKNLQNQCGFDEYPIDKVYRLIEPGPVLLVTTGSLVESTHNVMTIGFHMMMQHESPPLIGITLGPWNASFKSLKSQGECVLAVPSVEMAKVVVDIGNCSASGNDVDSKWEHIGLDALPAEKIAAPLVGDPNIIANIECIVEDMKMVSKYSMWVLKPVKAWINPNKKPGLGGKMFHHRGDGTFVVDGDIVDLKNRMVKWQEFQD